MENYFKTISNVLRKFTHIDSPVYVIKEKIVLVKLDLTTISNISQKFANLS